MRYLSRPKRRDEITIVGNLQFDDLGRIVQNLGQKWRKQLKLKKTSQFLERFSIYACPAGPKFSGICGCSTSLISPLACSYR